MENTEHSVRMFVHVSMVQPVIILLEIVLALLDGLGTSAIWNVLLVNMVLIASRIARAKMMPSVIT